MFLTIRSSQEFRIAMALITLIKMTEIKRWDIYLKNISNSSPFSIISCSCSIIRMQNDIWFSFALIFIFWDLVHKRIHIYLQYVFVTANVHKTNKRRRPRTGIQHISGKNTITFIWTSETSSVYWLTYCLGKYNSPRNSNRLQQLYLWHNWA